MFKEIESHPDFPKLERDILKWWEDQGVVKKYLKKNDSSSKRFSFLDGPITANNPMGVHHAHGRTLKDFFQRYKNMQGFEQRFQNGFDCQGLWLEVEEEKEKGFNSKREIEKYGVDKFCRDCRGRVEKFSKVQTEQSRRLGMFMDWDNSYYTMSEENNEYIWHFLKICWEKGLLRYGMDVLPWCARCGTAISQHELSDEGWKDVEHKAVYVKFKVKNDKCKISNIKLNSGWSGFGRLYFLAWTTTPWTLSSNTALAVHPEIRYVMVRSLGLPIKKDEPPYNEHYLVTSKERAAKVIPNFREEDIEAEFTGRELLEKGLEYESLYPEFAVQQGFTHKVIPWKDISEEEGTGIVHIAPGAGKEDFELSKEFNLKVIAALDESGIYQEGFGFLTGKSAIEVADEVVADLEKKDRLLNVETVVHSYPHCWRCKEELVFRVSKEWFIKTDPLREKLKKEARRINWMPSFACLRMLDWLRNMGDWPISRKRYWGLALPFWICEECAELSVIGSKKELREKAVSTGKVDDLPELHRPWIDEIKIKCSRCEGEATRVKDVGDCWLDAGIVPFSTVKYLKDQGFFKKWYPFEFITEYIPQIKLWFYSTLFMSVVLEGKAPWQNVLATGLVVDEKGAAMHKSKGNAIWFDEAVEKMGAGVMRWVYLGSTASRDAANLRFGYNVADKVRRRFFLILWNVYKFFVTYANLDGFPPSRNPKSEIRPFDFAQVAPSQVQGRNPKLSILDRWVLSRLNSLIRSVTETLDSYGTPSACRALEEFVLNDLSTWYVRRSRDRVGPTAPDGEDKETCFATLYEVLRTLALLIAPFAPFLAEELYFNLLQSFGVGKQSVHLEDWPEPQSDLIYEDLEEDMKKVREIVEKGHALRKKAGIKVRQPLKKCKVQSAKCKIFGQEGLVTLIRDELNVKEVLCEQTDSDEIVVELDTKLTDDLVLEGLVRGIIRQIQDVRKKERCKLNEWVVVELPDTLENKKVLEKFGEEIKRKTLTSDLLVTSRCSSLKIVKH